MVKMRIPIREQLGALVLLSALVALAVISIATWVTTHNFVLGIRASRLSLTASLKAAQIASSLFLMQSGVTSVSTRILIQSALQRYNEGNNTADNWSAPRQDLEVALEVGQQVPLLLQARLYPKNDTGLNGPDPVLAVTSNTVQGRIRMPYADAEGQPVYFGDADRGFPPALYPNLTFSTIPINSTFEQTVSHYDGATLGPQSTLLLGPLYINSTTALVSMTVPVVNNTSDVDILGWLSVVIDARLVFEVLQAQEGLGDTGVTLLVGPKNRTNRFANDVLHSADDGSDLGRETVQFVLPPNNTDERHDARALGSGKISKPFDWGDYPAVAQGFTTSTNATNNAGSMISTSNEEGMSVSVGYAMPRTSIVDWIVIVEQSHSEVWAPIDHMRNILLACVFGTLGVMLLLTLPVAHYSSRPIRRLRDATKRSVDVHGFHPDHNLSDPGIHDGQDEGFYELARKEGFPGVKKAFKRLRNGTTKEERREAERRRQFRIPGKVKDRKHFIHDELTDLTQTFNEMTDELMMQYEKLEERVAQRTAELELSKKAAEAANESKTLFIANISHELKTPLNGILGMCAVCMSEDDPIKLKRSLGIIYKSGDLLLNLLTDLLTFSKNQVGQHITIDEKEFLIRDVSSQVLAIFDKQAKEGGIDLSIRFEGPPDWNRPNDESNQVKNAGLFGSFRVREMVLWGDQHRILQVVINLVSNSLKFTPKGGSVKLIIRCLGTPEEIPHDRRNFIQSRHGSFQSRQSRHSRPSRQASNRGSGRNSRTAVTRMGSDSDISPAMVKMDTANEINPMEKPTAFAHVLTQERGTPTPPPGQSLLFEFEVVDTGPGIPPTLQQRIFEPFVQGDLGLSKKFGGTGLGLSICSQLAGLMGGSIVLSSEVGTGSTFTMQLPLKMLHTRADSTASSSLHGTDSRRTSSQFENPVGTTNSTTAAVQVTSDISDSATTVVAPSTQTPGSTTPAPPIFEADANPRLVGLSQPFFTSNPPMESPGSQMAAMERVAAEVQKTGAKVRVLVAEDNKTNQEVVLRMLKLEDVYDVTVAKDGQEALDLVKESMEPGHQPYNLIFMDVQMPNLDGLQSTRLIRQAGYSAPIVALTAYAEESNVKECFASGMDFFLSKPIRRPALKHVLKTYCAPIPEEPESQNTSPKPDRGEFETMAPATRRDTSPNAGVPIPDASTKTSTGAPMRPSLEQQRREAGLSDDGRRVESSASISPLS